MDWYNFVAMANTSKEITAILVPDGEISAKAYSQV